MSSIPTNPTRQGTCEEQQTSERSVCKTSGSVEQPQQLMQQSLPPHQELHDSRAAEEQENATGAVTPISHGMSPLVAAISTQASSTTTKKSIAHPNSLPSLQLPPQHQKSQQEVVPSQVLSSLPVTSTPSSTPASDSAMPAGAGTQAPEFLYQLTKMLKDENHDTIEWNQGRIEVHSPYRLEEKVLHKYFRHSKFASFQRQLNYFGFRKQAGKGKMAPCSYVNENLPSTDLSCLLNIKRKASVSLSAKDKLNKKNAVKNHVQVTSDKSTAQANPVLVGILQRSSMSGGSASAEQPVTSAYQAVAQAAVGRGIRHGYSGVASVLPPRLPSSKSASTEHSTSASKTQSEFGIVNNPLSQLVTNYQNTLNDMSDDNNMSADHNYSNETEMDPTPINQMTEVPFAGFLSREDSLIDLAMIPIPDNGVDNPAGNLMNPPMEGSAGSEEDGFNFIDFPNPDLYPINETNSNKGN